MRSTHGLRDARLRVAHPKLGGTAVRVADHDIGVDGQQLRHLPMRSLAVDDAHLYVAAGNEVRRRPKEVRITLRGHRPP